MRQEQSYLATNGVAPFASDWEAVGVTDYLQSEVDYTGSLGYVCAHVDRPDFRNDPIFVVWQRFECPLRFVVNQSILGSREPTLLCN